MGHAALAVVGRRINRARLNLAVCTMRIIDTADIFRPG